VFLDSLSYSLGSWLIRCFGFPFGCLQISFRLLVFSQSSLACVHKTFKSFSLNCCYFSFFTLFLNCLFCFTFLFICKIIAGDSLQFIALSNLFKFHCFCIFHLLNFHPVVIHVLLAKFAFQVS
jgi:hypothetical protein